MKYAPLALARKDYGGSRVDPQEILDVEAAVSDCAERLLAVLMPDAGPCREPALEVIRTELSMCASDIGDLFRVSDWEAEPETSPSFWLRGMAR